MVLFLGKLPMKNWQKALAACGLVACMLCIPGLLPKSEIGDVARMEGNIQVVESALSSGSYADIRVTAGIPVRWITHADEDEINGCNNRMLCRDLGLELTFTPGENLLEFTANTPGVYGYSCWMGSTWRFWRPRMPTARCAPPSIPARCVTVPGRLTSWSKGTRWCARTAVMPSAGKMLASSPAAATLPHLCRGSGGQRGGCPHLL